jgi:hypothetical protein
MLIAQYCAKISCSVRGSTATCHLQYAANHAALATQVHIHSACNTSVLVLVLTVIVTAVALAAVTLAVMLISTVQQVHGSAIYL